MTNICPILVQPINHPGVLSSDGCRLSSGGGTCGGGVCLGGCGGSGGGGDGRSLLTLRRGERAMEL